MSFSLRRFTEADIPGMIDMGGHMHAESAFARLDYCPEKCRDLGLFYLNNPETCFAAVAEQDGRLVGMFMGYVTEYYFGRERLAHDILWYVLPEVRGSRAGLMLLKAFEDWAKERGVSEVCIGISTAVEFERTGAVLNRLGYVHVGGNYKLPVVA